MHGIGMFPCTCRAAARLAAAALGQGGVYCGAKDAVRLCMGKNGLVAGRLGGRNEKAVRLDEVAEVEMVAINVAFISAWAVYLLEGEGKISDRENGQQGVHEAEIVRCNTTRYLQHIYA
jgi:hypothetical protein